MLGIDSLHEEVVARIALDSESESGALLVFRFVKMNDATVQRDLHEIVDVLIIVGIEAESTFRQLNPPIGKALAKAGKLGEGLRLVVYRSLCVKKEIE